MQAGESGDAQHFTLLLGLGLGDALAIKVGKDGRGDDADEHEVCRVVLRHDDSALAREDGKTRIIPPPRSPSTRADCTHAVVGTVGNCRDQG